jgi:hypothetical protein
LHCASRRSWCPWLRHQVSAHSLGCPPPFGYRMNVSGNSPLSVGRKEVPARVVSPDRRLGRLRRSGRATLPLVTSASCSFGTAQNPDHLGEGMRQQSTFQEKTLPPETTSTGASSGEPRCLLSGSCPQLFDTALRTIHHPVDENSVGVGRYLGLKILMDSPTRVVARVCPSPKLRLGLEKQTPLRARWCAARAQSGA